ncbi:autotransporter-associated beta strand repeat-containing protein [Leclercia adecarboxylata]|uniref:autotransporter-associated beta strand repeat-containing protein n=1 Tax=Leclercia adecarboxylata TaxID=83655 RepID=UPI002DB584FF|nr:autotransporter-associated beta strand repeat-containing protein [Leclercia adecarboxylata]MEB6377854.1 autotransporter-associated beta strand repeat-containing protein [Leclercia adecarboxylata]
MNKIYRHVWSHVAGCFVAVSELSTSHTGTKRCRRRLMVTGAAPVILLGLSGVASADDVNWASVYPSYLFSTDPAYNFDTVIETGIAFSIDNQVLPNHYAPGTTLNILGPIPLLPDVTSGNGVSGRTVAVTSALPGAVASEGDRILTITATDSQGAVTPITSANIGEFTYSPNPANPQQNQELNVEVPGLDGSFQVISIYDSSTFVSADDTPVGNMQLSVYDPASVRIMNAFGIAEVGADGGTANINVGADTTGTTPIAAAANTLDLLTKNSTLARADAGRAATSAVNWLSDNYIHFRPAAVVSAQSQGVGAQSTQYNYTLTLPNYTELPGGRVVQVGSRDFTITSSDDIADVNNYLTGQGAYAGSPQIQYWLTAGAEVNGEVIDSAVEAQTVYNTIITGLLSQAQSTQINLTYNVWEDRLAHNNNATLGTGDLRVIYANGAGATGTVTPDASLAVDGASAVMEAFNGGAIVNNGTINAWRSSGSSPTSVAMLASYGTAVNTGVINAGLFLEKDGVNQNVSNAGSVGMAGLTDATLTNQGYINVAVTDNASHTAWGMAVGGNSSLTNTGTITLTGNSRNPDGRAGGYAILSDATGTATNTGQIYIGATPVLSATAPEAINLVGSGALSAGMYSTGKGDIENSATGVITLLSGTRNAAGMLIEGGTEDATNNGQLNVLGTLTPTATGEISAAANYGMYVKDNGGVVTNNGNIFVDGDNNIALNILAQTANASLNSTASSAIVVGSAGDTGGTDNQPYTYRNYAVYAEGLNNFASQVTLNSDISLLSAGAIGVHARGNATIDIGPDASLAFQNTQQIGYYAWGQGSSINITNATITDNSQTQSILFAVDHGATFNGETGTGSNYDLIVSGQGSTGVFANGVDDLNNTEITDDVPTQLTTGDASITVSGLNAVGVKVTGGANGAITDGAIALTGNNTTAVLVDGRNYNIDATIDPLARITQVTSDAVITSAAGQTGIVGYNVGYLGNLTLNAGAAIDLLGNSSTGIILHDNGQATVTAPVSVAGTNNIGVDIQNAGLLNNSGAITVSGADGSGNIGLRVQGAGATVSQLGTVTANGGLAAVQLAGDGATLTVNGTGNQIAASNGADGVRIDSTGASSFNASNTTIDVSGTGAGINNNASASNINLNNVIINSGDGPAIRTAVTFTAEGTGNVLNVAGSGSGFAFMQADGSQTAGDLTIGTGYTINGNGTDSTGILARTTGNVNSGTAITMGATAGAAIEATDASSLSNSGVITTSSDTGSTILAQNTAAFSNSGTITSTSTTNAQSLITLNGTAASRTITNTGVILSQSEEATVIDASGTANNTIVNSGTLRAASDTGQVVLTGSGNDVMNINAGTTQGEITLGSGGDQFGFTAGEFAGGVTFTGADGNDSATFGDISLARVSHVLSEGGTNNTLTFNNTRSSAGAANIGSLAADDLAQGTNIGTGWSTLNLEGDPADIRVVNDLVLSGAAQINVNNGATLRTGDNAVTSGEATVRQYNIATSGANSLVSFDGAGDQTYSGVISGSGGMERIGGGDTVLLGENTYTGNTLIGPDSELALGNGGTTGRLSATTNITDNGLLTVNRSDEVALNGVISGSGAFRQLGSGVTRLGGNNSYAGTTTVEQGTLLINGVQTGTGLTTVQSGATLGGYGTLGGDVLFETGTVLRPGDDSRGNGTGLLTINGDLTLASDTDSQFQLGEVYTPGGALNDLVTVAGDLTLDGVVNVALTAGGSFLPGVYRLFNYGGTLINNTMDIGSLPPNDANQYAIQTNIANQVNLVLDFVVPANQLQFWDGDLNATNHGDGTSGNGVVDGGFGSWNALIAGTSNNWTQANGVGNAPWSQRAFAVFQGAADTVLINNAFGDVITSGMQFTTDGYLLTPDLINQDSQLHMVATNIAGVITPDNSYDAVGGTHGDSYFAIRVGDGAAGADVNTTLNVDLVQDSDADGAIRLLKTDPGRLILNGDNQYSGGTEVWNGTLQVSKDSSLGDAGTFVLLKNGATFQTGADYATDRLFILDGAAGGAFDVYGNTFTSRGGIGGDGPLAVRDSSAGNGDGVLDLNVANTYQGDTTITGKNGTGTLTVNANATGALGRADSTVTLTDAARLNINNASAAEAHLFNVNNATLAFNDAASADSSTINLAGGTLELTDTSSGGAATVNVDATSQMLLSGSADAGSSVTSNSGTVAFAGNAQAASARITNLAGGNVTLADAAGNTAIGSLSGAGNVNLGAATLTEGHLGLNDTISGIISGSGGGLVKTGGGTLTLTGENSYTGATAVEQGVLLINGSQSAATGAATVAGGATLGGAGTLGGSVSVADDGHLTPGATLSSVGELTMGSLTLAQNAQLDFQFGQSGTPGGALNDLLTVNGDLNLDGKLNITQTPGGNFDVGVYRVIDYSGTLTNNILEIGTAPAAADDLYVQTSIDGQVNLVNRTGYTMRFWDGFGGAGGSLKNNDVIDGGNGVWQNSNGNDNWTTDRTNPEGAFNTPFSDGAFAVFGGESGNVTVDNSLGAVTISGAQFMTDGYVINEGAITTNTADTVMRVGDGTVRGAGYTATINSQITGSGGLNKTDLGTLVLNGNNTWQGGTVISDGVLQVSGDQNLGAAGTGITLSGGTLRYGAAFDTARAVTLAGDGGAIDTNGNSVSLLTAVGGSGNLSKQGEGTLTLTQDSTFQGETTIRNGTLQLGNGGNSGSVLGNVVNLATLVVNRANTLDLNGIITGTGDFIQRGEGTTVLNGLNRWTGYTLVENGTLLAGGINRFSSGSSHIVSSTGTLDTGGHNQTVADLVNQGTVNLRGGNVGSTLTVQGDYVGLDGTLKIAARQNSPGVADHLVIDGGTASGTTLLDIDVSQLGEPTEGDGILVVDAINGGVTTAQTTRDAFTLGSDYLTAGAWEYQLFAGDINGAGEDWFLRAGYRPDVPGFDTLPSIIRQADLFVLGTLHLRQGDERPYRADNPADQEGRFWARYLTKTVDQKLDDATGSTSHSQYNGMQMGLDLWQDDKWRSGIYTTFMDIDSAIDGNTGMSGGAAYNSTFSTYLGGYATWTDTDGFYVDNVLQYGYHSVDLKNMTDHETYHPDGNSVTASVEVGKPWYFGDTGWAFEPQAQLIWQWSDFDDVTLNDPAKTRVSVHADSAVIGRLGARLTAEYDTNHGKVKPYVRVNYWQELTDGQDEVTYRNTANSDGKTTLKANQQFAATEAAVGATWMVTDDVQAYTEVGKTWDNSGKTSLDADISASLGMKIRF